MVEEKVKNEERRGTGQKGIEHSNKTISINEERSEKDGLREGKSKGSAACTRETDWLGRGANSRKE